MKQVLSWDKPKKKESTKKWMERTADGAPPGVYQPNMSEKDMKKYKAKKINGDDPRIEIRKTFQWTNFKNKAAKKTKNYHSQTVMIFRKNKTIEEPEVLISSNGKIAMTSEEFADFLLAIEEAKNILATWE